MERYSVAQRTKIVELYLKNNRSVVLTQRAYRRFFKVRTAPTQNTIYLTIRNFENRGCLEDVKPTGRPRSTRTQENIERVKKNLAKIPNASVRWRANKLNIPRRSLQRIITKDIQNSEKIQNADIEKPRSPEQMTMAALAESLRNKKAAKLKKEKNNTKN